MSCPATSTVYFPEVIEDDSVLFPFGFNAAQCDPPSPEAKVRTIGLLLKNGADIEPKTQGFLVPEFIPDDTLIVLAGAVGLGKTTATLSWAADITNGRIPIVGGKREPANVLMISNEDSEAQIQRTFIRLGGNLSRLYVEDEDSDLPWNLGDPLALEARLEQLKPALVLIDSLTTHVPLKTDMNSHGELAPLLVQMRKMAARCNCAICVIHHTNKLQTGDPISKISGTVGISATARHVLLCAVHPEDAGRRIVAIAKTNLVRYGAPAYQFKLAPFSWEGSVSQTAADLLLPPPSTPTMNPAEVFLRLQLKDGSKSVSDLETLAESLKISRPTLYRTKKRMGVVTSRSGFPATATWSLPVVSEPCVPPETETTGECERDNNNNCKDLAQLSQLSQSSHSMGGDTTGETTAISRGEA
jgi:hypothetical protein